MLRWVGVFFDSKKLETPKNSMNSFTPSTPSYTVQFDDEDGHDEEWLRHIEITQRTNSIDPFTTHPQTDGNESPITTTSKENKPVVYNYGCAFYRSGYNILRFGILIVNLFFIFLCVLYGYGQIVTLQLDDYFCESKTLQQIREHSIESNLNEGTEDGCWTTSNNKIDESKLYNAGSSIAYKSVFNFTAANIVKCALFMIIALALAIICIIFLVEIIKDCKRFCNGSWGNDQKPERSKQSFWSKLRWSKIGQKVFGFKRKYYDNHLSTHTCYWVINVLGRETFEIIIQSIVFLQYAGAQSSLLYYFYDSNKTIAAESKEYVMLFAIFLSFNCILSGLLWLLYLYKNNISFIKEGKSFGYLLFIIDAIFDTFYAVFPLLLLGDNITFGTAAAALYTDSIITFISVYYPLFFLTIKVYVMLRTCTYLSRQQWHKEYSPTDQSTLDYDQDVMNETIENKLANSNKCCFCCKMLFDGAYLDYNISMKYGKYKVYGLVIQFLRRLILLLWSISFIVFGIVTLVNTHYHFTWSEYLCNNPSLEQIALYPEIKLWQYCNYKVYPIWSENACNCRGFVMNKIDVQNNEKYLQNSTIDALLENYYMLEVFKLEASEMRLSMNLGSKQLQSKNVRVFYIDSVSIDYVDPIIGYNWQNLEFLVLRATFVKTTSTTNSILPNTTALLENIQYLDISNNLYLPQIVSNMLCNFKRLRVFITKLSGMNGIPRCLVDLTDLRYIDITGSKGDMIDIGLLNLPNLNEFNWPNSMITELSFTGYKDMETKSFDYNPNTAFGWIGSNLCWRFLGEESIIYQNQTTTWSQVRHEYHPYLWQFLNDTNSCKYGCSYDNILDYGTGICYETDWQNGICNEACNVERCGYDGGDCNQLCECDMELLLNNRCDLECNSTQCNYDQYDCISRGPDSYLLYDNYTQCMHETQCKREWIGDGLCDRQCAVDICDMDQNDCNVCSGTCEVVMGWFVNLFANAITPDYLVDVNESCHFWPFLENLGREQYEILNEINCTSIFPMYDYDGDGKLSAYETMDLFLIGSDNGDRIGGEVDCSVCSESVYQYMHGN